MAAACCWVEPAARPGVIWTHAVATPCGGGSRSHLRAARPSSSGSCRRAG